MRVEPSRVGEVLDAGGRTAGRARRLNGAIASILLILPLLAIGCDRRATGAATAPLPYAEAIPGDGTIIGRVTFAGTPPPMVAPEAGHAIDTEAVLIGEHGALQNAVVSIDGAPMSDGRHEPAVTFDQKDYRFVPHVAAVQIGQPMSISNHDQCMHTVDMLSEINSPQNLSFSGPGTQTVVFGSPEYFHVRCDIHPNMSAWIAVLPNPYFAVTGAEGSFVIHHVPAGDFTLSVWHERFGKLHQPLTIKAGQTVKLDFVYQY